MKNLRLKQEILFPMRKTLLILVVEDDATITVVHALPVVKKSRKNSLKNSSKWLVSHV